MTWYSGEVQASSFIKARLIVDESRSGNTSTITARLQYRRTNSYNGQTFQYGNGCNIYITIDGQTFTIPQAYNSYSSIPAYNNDWITFATATKNISHNEAKTISCSWSTANMGAYLSSSGSMSCTLAAFITKLSAIGVNATSRSNDISARFWWMNRAGVQVHIACEEIDDSGNYISTIEQWTNQAGTAGQISEKYYSLTAAQRLKYDNLGRNRIRWTLKTVSSGTVLYYDCHDYDYNRASTPSLSAFTVGSSVPIRTNRQRSSMTHTAVILIANSTIRTINDIGTSINWDSAADEGVIYAQETQKSSTTVTVRLNTYIGSTLIGTKTAQVNATFRLSEVAPIFTNFTYRDSNTNVVAVTGNNQVFVKGQSNLIATVPVADKMIPRQATTGKSYTFTLGSISITQAFSNTADVSANFGKVLNAGSQRLTVKAFDNRSISTSIYKDIQVIDYASPTLTPKIERLNGFEDRTTVKLEGEFYLVPVNNVAKNTITSIKCRYKKSQETSWKSWQELSFTTSQKNGKGIVTGSSGGVLFDLDNTSAWDFEFQITDHFSSTIVTGQVSVGIPIMFFSSDGRISINCMPDGYDKGLYLKAKDQVFKQIYPVGTIFETTQATSPEENFGGTWRQIGTRTVGSTTIYTYQRSY